jgi:plasmid maintenance system killer protein
MLFLAKLNIKATKHEKELFDRIGMVNRAQHTQGLMDVRYRHLEL